MTLADGLASRRDNFLLLRFIAASMVIYGHGSAITGGTGWPELFKHLGWGVYSGAIAVDIFFVVSGFMITGSFLRRQHLGNFLWARVLRIYPAFLFCLVISAFVLGPIYTSLSIGAYFNEHGVIRYVTQNLKLQTSMVWNLPGVFTDNPVRTTVNGAIWTLPAEFRMYLWVALVGVLGVLSRKWLCSLLLVVLVACGIFQPDHLLWVPVSAFLRLAGFFAIGVFCYLHRERIPVGWPYAAACILAAYVLRDTSLYPYAFALALSAFAFAFAYRIPWHGFNRFGDYSYGIYLWGFPMQQVIAHHFPTLSPIENAIPSFALALAMALVSWHVIEQPALRLKSLPGDLTAKFRKSP
jgi:peptidoglycan/LPS O-acetylase OafA/YrhL